MTHETKTRKPRTTDANRDPLTGAPGAHPVGTGVGATVGAIVGGYAGKGVAEAIDPTVEVDHWRETFKTRPYARSGSSFDEYEPAYRYGIDAFDRYPERSFDAAEGDLSRDWETVRGTSSLDWERAKHAARDAWKRLSDSTERALPGDSDRDGK